MRTLRYADRRRSQVGFVWPMMYTLQRHFIKLSEAGYDGKMPQAERANALQLCKDRWIYLHVPVHSLANALNPRFVGISSCRL
eukprot:3454967-Prymnesium_polylepis.1